MTEEKKKELQEEVKVEMAETPIKEITLESEVANEEKKAEATEKSEVPSTAESTGFVVEEATDTVASIEGKEEVPESRTVKKSTEEVAVERETDPSIRVEERKEENESLKFLRREEDIDWDETRDGGFSPEYGNEEREEMEKRYAETLNEVHEKELIKGVVVGITNQDVIVNIGFKSDGLVGLTEFKDTPDLKTGDVVEVYVEEQENAKGQLILSRRKAKIVKAWELIQHAFDDDIIIEGMVKRRTKGGLIVDVHGVEAFLPGSQIDVKPIRDFDIFVGKEMEVKVIKINYSNDNVVVSHKILIEKDIEKQRAEILNNLEKGQVLEGVIKNMTNFGVFIDLGGVDGLLHIADISWARINHPEDALTLDEKVNVVVLDFDDDKKRISLGMKQLTDHPWDFLDATISEGSRVKGKIVNVADYGAFLEIIHGVEGLIHVSEMSWSQHLRNPSDFMQVGDELEAVVLTIDREEHKMSVGIKQLSENPWTKQDVLTKYAVGEKHSGTVRHLTNFGLFIELEEGIDGLVHVSDLSWTKRIKHPSEFVKVNDTLEVVVTELDVESRRLALSHRHLEENPWETFESVFERGSIHKCTIMSLSERGAVLELPYGIEGHASTKNLHKEGGGKATVDETLEFAVMDFSKEEKHIYLSHTATWKAVKGGSKKQSAGKKNNTLDKINKEVEKSTLGDLDALAVLKQQMEVSTPKKGGKKVEKKDEKKQKTEDEEIKVKQTAPKKVAKKQAEDKPKAAKEPGKKVIKKEKEGE